MRLHERMVTQSMNVFFVTNICHCGIKGEALGLKIYVN